MPSTKPLLTATLLSVLAASELSHVTAAPLQPAKFETPDKGSMVHSWWHWISGNITKEGITKDLESMKARGITQVTILNVGGHVSSKVDVPNIKFDSPEWHRMFRFSLEEAKRLGISVGVHNCDGWSTSGGPWVTPAQSMKEFVWSKTNLIGGAAIEVTLPEPPSILDFYEDVVILAYPNLTEASSFIEAEPSYLLGKNALDSELRDGNPLTHIDFQARKSVTISFDEPYEAEQIAIMPHLVFAWTSVDETPINFTVSSSMDGERFEEVAKVSIQGANQILRADIPKTKARHFRFTSDPGRNRFKFAELELLKKGESASFPTRIHGLLQKTAGVKTSTPSQYDPTPIDGRAVLKQSDVRDVTRFFEKESGSLKWNAPAGEWTVLRFGYTTTGVENKPATPEGLGLEIDKMDARAARAHFEAFTGKLIETAGEMTGKTFKFTLIDSWECLFQNWTPNFPAEFASRRGYSLKNWIPVLCGEIVEGAELSDGFLHDFRRTIADLIGENYYKAWADLCHAHDLEMHAEAIYGGGAYPPLDILKANSYADLPMLEFWARPDKENFLPLYKPSRKPRETFPSMSSLAYQKPVVGSEAYTNRCYYSEAPGDLKAHGDASYCAGVNQMIIHSYVHQPIEKKPGVTLGQFGGPFNRNNPWWRYTTDWMTYQARVQYLLQRGEPVVDCVYYVGDQFPQKKPERMSIDLPEGFRMGACDFEMLTTKAKVIDGQISLGGDQQFAFLILPARESMELDTLRAIHRLVKAGATVYGPRPARPLGVLDIAEGQSDFDQLIESLWEGSSDEELGSGRVVSGISIKELIKKKGLQPDFAASHLSAREVMYIHKKTPSEDLYFVFNQTEEPLHTDLFFRIEGRSPEVWQAETGEMKNQPIFVQEDGRIRMPMTFAPGESFFIVFRADEARPHVTEVRKNGEILFPNTEPGQEPLPLAEYRQDGLTFRSASEGTYSFLLSNGERLEKALQKPQVIDVAQGGAAVSFEPIYAESIDPVELKTLASITESEDLAIKYFAGFLDYTITFELPDSFLADGRTYSLNFGELDAAGEASLNGKPLGDIWRSGLTLPVENLQAGKNILKVRVATTCRNRIIGDLKTYNKVQTIFTTAPMTKLLDKSMALKPSGLIGPVLLSAH